jgi:hypothetical protein
VVDVDVLWRVLHASHGPGDETWDPELGVYIKGWRGVVPHVRQNRIQKPGAVSEWGIRLMAWVLPAEYEDLGSGSLPPRRSPPGRGRL